ncbi:TonB-dependent receptor [Tenacibaculum sp. UWU-22]|uniref:TonB-dependent receptor domain-containing protein n=1 Tax=Tenacibaculum sp. UWU-22 TaxID=3234187 RepID=UPI0034DADA02
MMKKIVLFILLSVCELMFSQGKGIVSGLLSDKEMDNAPLPFANVFIKNTTIGTTTDMDGNYTLSVTPGNHIIVFSFVGYQTIEKPIEIKTGTTTTLNVIISANEGVALKEIEIKGSASKASTSSIISTQKKSVQVVERVGSEQLKNQGIGDIATAVTKATGTQKQEGSSVIFVRGLGDRFNTTTLNGLSIPSDNPENKNIDLGIFKTSMIEYLSLDKVYSPLYTGDFGGAHINIVSKEYIGKPYVKVGLGNSANLQTIAKDKFKLQDGAPGFLGFKTSTFKNKVNPYQTYPFTTRWNFKNAANTFNFNINIESATKFTFEKDKNLYLFAYVGFDNDYLYSNGEEGFYDATGGMIKNSHDIDRYEYKTNTTGFLNLTYKKNADNKINFTSNYIHSSSQAIRMVNGNYREVGNYDDVVVRKTDNKITDTWINQLFGNHKLGSDWQTNWAVGYNYLNSKRPDVLQNTIDNADPNHRYFLTGSSILNSRYFDDMKDNNFVANFKVTKNWKEFKFDFGYDGNYKKRNFNYNIIGLEFKQNPSTINPDDIDAIINSSNNSMWSYNTLQGYGHGIFDPFYYNFTQLINAAFLNVDYKISEQFIAQIGARYDNISIQNNWYSAEFGIDRSNKKYNKILPALNVKYEINSQQNIRFSASKTYTLPQAKELVPVSYYDLTNNTYGNSNVYPSDNYNGDLKWELFPKRGEVFSITGFAKYIKNPIARSTFSSASSSDMTYFNIADYGTVFGVEAEIRKDIYKVDNHKIYTFLNGTYMNTKQKLNPEKVSKENNKSIEFSGQTYEKLQGAADFLANINLGYNAKWGDSQNNQIDFVVSYTYTGKTLFAIGTNNTGNFYQQPINILDANLNFKLNNIGIGVFAKNLLNPAFKINQKNKAGSFIYKNYKKGEKIGVSLSYKF